MTLAPALTEILEARLRDANTAFHQHYPGDPAPRQPVHTVYGGAHLFTPEVCKKLGGLALRALDEHGPFPGVPPGIEDRIRVKLATEPVEDYRIDFEDGYGKRSGAEEDTHAVEAARRAAEAFHGNLLPYIFGIRIKPFTSEHYARAFRTLDLFLTTLLEHSGGAVPNNFVVTLPKVTLPAQIAALADLYDIFEDRFGLPSGILKLEFLVETTACIQALPEVLAAARGRCIAAHFGVFDYTAAYGIVAGGADILHPVCDLARFEMKAALAGRGIFLSDGITNVLPVGTRAQVHRGWELHFRHVRHSLANGFYQSWDVHPAQLVSRFAAVFTFFREHLETIRARLLSFQAAAGQAALTSNTFDDAATARGLVAYLERAQACGAVSRD